MLFARTMGTTFYQSCKAIILLAGISILIAGCSDESTTEPSCLAPSSFNTSTPGPKTYSEAYCDSANAITYGTSHAITINAEYEFRTNGNGAIGAAAPIRFAEVIVKDSSNNVIQCGNTDATGQAVLQVPQSGATYTVYVNSRSNNSTARVYVLEDPTSNDHYSITQAFVADGSKTLTTMTADGDEDTDSEVKGGAFNIFDQLVKANEYLKTETAGCDGTYSGCVPFNPTNYPIANTYWKAGFNPGSYFNFGPVSFYLTGQNELYILGGLNGDVKTSDADHFDNSVIVHEYGHYIEDVVSASDSPGGSHNGNSIIDARLAWSEGFANFFQAAVLNNPEYRDTYGNISCGGGCTGVFFDVNVEDPGAGGQSPGINLDVPIRTDEGNFREFSITRLLWDIIDNTTTGGEVETVNQPFAEFWGTFSGDFKNSDKNFRNIGLFHEGQISQASAGDWSSARTEEKHAPDRRDYATPITLSSSSCSKTITDDANNYSDDGPFADSNQLVSNDFFEYEHPGGALNISLSYTTSGSAPADLDLYLYKKDYRYGQSITSSTNELAAGATSGSEAISLSCLVAGTYLINVMLYTGSSSLKNGIGQRDTTISPATYNLTVNGDNVCSSL